MYLNRFLRNHMANWTQISYGDSLWQLAKIYANCFGHMTKMATTPIYVKNPFNFFFKKQKVDDLGTWQ